MMLREYIVLQQIRTSLGITFDDAERAVGTIDLEINLTSRRVDLEGTR